MNSLLAPLHQDMGATKYVLLVLDLDTFQYLNHCKKGITAGHKPKEMARKSVCTMYKPVINP